MINSYYKFLGIIIVCYVIHIWANVTRLVTRNVTRGKVTRKVTSYQKLCGREGLPSEPLSIEKALIIVISDSKFAY